MIKKTEYERERERESSIHCEDTWWRPCRANMSIRYGTESQAKQLLNEKVVVFL